MTQPQLVGRVSRIHRRILKSVRGRRVESAEIGFAGMVGDRDWVVVDAEHGTLVLTAKQLVGRPLLDCEAWRTPAGDDFLQLPKGDSYSFCGGQASRALSGLLHRPVRLVQPKRERRPLPTNAGFSLREGVGYDSSPLHFVTTTSLTAVGLDQETGDQRLRPSFIIETVPGLTGFVEEDWVDRTLLQIGSTLRIIVRKRTERCAMPGLQQADLPTDSKLLRRLQREGEPKMWLGVYAVVLDPGVISEGDEVTLL